jgi:hypothetical protein
MVKSQNISVKLDFLQGFGAKCVNKVSATLLLAVLHIQRSYQNNSIQFSSEFGDFYTNKSANEKIFYLLFEKTVNGKEEKCFKPLQRNYFLGDILNLLRKPTDFLS